MKVIYKYAKIYLVSYLCVVVFLLFMAILNTYDTLGNILLVCVLIVMVIRVYFSYKRLGDGIFYNDTHLIFIINGKEETIKRTDISSIHFKKKIIYSLINF